MKLFRTFFILTLLLCVPGIVFSAPIGQTDKVVQEIADPVLDGLLKGLAEKDYTIYLENFDKLLKASIKEEQFLEVTKQIEEALGSYEKREYLGFLTYDDMTVILWKGSFDGTENDVMIRLLMSKRADKYFVTGIWFQ